MEEISMEKYEELVGKYIAAKNQIKPLEEEAKEIMNQLDHLMHLEEINTKRVFINALDTEYECKYVDRKTKSTDFVMLAEVVSDEIYNEIISEKTSTYLQVKPTPKAKSSSREKPVKDNGRSSFSIPKAKIK